MGNNGPCCGKETDQPTSMRELLSLQDTEACRSWMEPFLNEFPKIRQVYTKKPIYCYRIDRQQYTQKQDMTCIGKIPAKGSSGELIIMYKEGYLYQGDVVEGIRQGCGRMISADGDCYEGQWKGNEPDGEGMYEQYAPKRKLTGVWSSGFLNGKGRAIYEDGSVYQGDFYQNSRHGKGRIQYSDGTIYQGGFKANLMEGFGTLIGINHKYEGSWKAGKMEGAGKSYWYNQDDELLQTYEGEYLNGLKHGMGEYRWSNGRVYAGQWQHGQIKEKIMEELKQSVKTR